MMKKRTRSARVLAAILTAAMIVTSAPYTALAAEQETGIVTLQNPIELGGESGQAEDVSDGSDRNPGTGDVSDGSHRNPGTGDVSGSDGNGETGDVSGGSGKDVSGDDSREAVSGNDVVVYTAKSDSTGTLTVEGSKESYSYDAGTDTVIVKDGADLIFHSAEGYGAENPSVTRIFVEKDADATLTLDGVYINASGKAGSPLEIEEDSDGVVKVVLKNNNALTASEYCAGIQKNGTGKGTLTISGSGTLTAQGGGHGAGIGSGYKESGGHITISGGTVTATGGNGGAGIGGGMYGNVSDVTISEGTVIATGGESGAGIGGGYTGAGSDITISGGTVTATGGAGFSGAGIGGGYRGAGSDITISGGTVTATGGNYGAGIGGGYTGAGSDITISGGTVIATGGSCGAGIGGGYNRAGSNITVSGGTVTAKKGSGATDIGGGFGGSTATVSITGGSVKTDDILTGVTNGTIPVYYTEADLSEEYGAEAAVTGVSETAYGMKDVSTDKDGKIYLYLPEDEDETTIVFGTHLYSGHVSSQNVTDNRLTKKAECTYEMLVIGDPAYYERSESTYGIQIKDGANLTLKSGNGCGKDNYSRTRIFIEANASVTLTLDGVYIDAGKVAYGSAPILIPENSTGDVDIVLKGENALKASGGYAGIQKNGDAEGIGTLTISGDGSLTVTGGRYGAGIGGGDNGTGSHITINGGTVTATGGQDGAGIGGGYGEAGSNITISGGMVTATGGDSAAGIGGGYLGTGSHITINGGTVTATGGEKGAGIGGGNCGAGSNITISGGTVTAESKATGTYASTGAGIGGGYGEAGSNITISGGTVTAESKATGTDASTGAGIGGGYCGAGSNITISGGTVTAESKATGTHVLTGAGIGGGYGEAGSNITISGGTVTAESKATGTYASTGAGIGGGYCGAGSNITISGGTVTAESKATGTHVLTGAGIGGGYGEAGSNITISGGTVTAESKATGTHVLTGAGIGGGYGGAGSDITITGGNVKASSVSCAAGADGEAVYPVRVDLLLLVGKKVPVKEASLETYHALTGETQSIAYNLKDVCTMQDGYLYLYLPVNEEDTVTRFQVGNAGFEGVIKKTAYSGEEYNELTLKNDPDGKGDYGDVPREEVPEDGVIPDGIWMAGISEEGYTYTGKAITPAFKVYDGRMLLTVKKDYTVSYKNNINAASCEDGKKAPTITVKSTGNYKGTETCTFTITPASLEESNPRIKAENLYLAAPAGKNPKGIKAVPVVTDNGKKLTENKDYTLTHVTLNDRNAENNNRNSYVNAGSYVLKITGKGNYTGSRWILVTLADAAQEQILMSKVTVAKIPDVTYDADLCESFYSDGMTPALTVTYGSGKNKVTLYKEGDINADGETVSWKDADYTVEWRNNKQVGTATAILRGTERVAEDGTVTRTYFGEKSITFKIKGQTLSAGMVSWADGSKNISLVYNGEAQNPGVSVKQQKKVKNADGKTVTETVVLREYNAESGVGDYTVSYLKNVDAGTATAVITGVNGYTGTVKKTFKITQADLAATDTETKITADNTRGASGSNDASGSQSGTDGTIKVAFAKNGAKPAVVVTAKLADGKTVTLTEGKDYTVSYANNKAVSEGKNLAEKKLPLITIKGKGNYKGSVSRTFTITNKSLADTEAPITVTVADAVANRNKGKFVSKPVVTDADGVKLKEKTDYTLTYSLLTEEGAVELDTKTGIVNEPGSVIRITVTGAGNYAGEGSVRTVDYRITELDFNKVTVKVVPRTLPYTTKPVTLTEDDLILTMKVGSGKQAVVETLPLITDGDSTKDGYMIVGYKNNVNKGTAQVTLKGCGKYGGTKNVKFYIGTRPFLWWLRNV